MSDRNDDRQLMDIDDDSMVNDDGGPIRMSRAVYRLPLVACEDGDVDGDGARSPLAIASRFPDPDARFLADHPVSSFSVDPTGRTLVIGTVRGTVEVWQTGTVGPRVGGSPTTSSSPARVQTASVRESFLKRHRRMTMDEARGSTGDAGDARPTTAGRGAEDKPPDDMEFDDTAAETRDDLALLEAGFPEEEEIPHKHPTTRISQVYLPRHLPAHRCGFVTKQRSPAFGTTLLLWQTAGMSSDRAWDFNRDHFQIVAMINVPLAAQCHPQVHFDGRRLVVFGKDHIGLVFLVYHVLGTRHDQRDFDEGPTPAGGTRAPKRDGGRGRTGEESGGVVQVGDERRVRFVRRVRHAGLDGLEYYDSMLLSANERFLVANTKAGNLVGEGGSHNAREGLLVVDLQDQGRR